jgi:hypothetical protein
MRRAAGGYEATTMNDDPILAARAMTLQDFPKRWAG